MSEATPRAARSSEATERWLPIAGYEGLYEVSDLGQVRFLGRHSTTGRWLPPRLLNQCAEVNGILNVRLNLGSKIRRHSVHRLVSQAFLDFPGDAAVFHLDGDQNNCSAENLTYRSRTCVSPGCGNNARASGLCSGCYKRSKRPVVRSFHRLTNVDPESRAATCEVCGPVVAKAGGRRRPWICPTSRRNISRRYLASKYGMTLDDLNDRIVAQGGRCAICRQSKRLHVDHDHVTGEARDMLCHACNVAIGFLGDNPSYARSAADYLERHAQMKLPLTM